ncbi:MAG TPA: isochorismatase family protein [Candidatus Binatia bacterium]|jgi:isochorismate hydrolase
MKEWEKFFPEEERNIYVTGTTTCGCVRGTVLDGYSYGFPVFVVEECVFDRSRISHLVNLFEMNSKYATVIDLSEALTHVNRLKRVEGRKVVAS